MKHTKALHAVSFLLWFLTPVVSYFWLQNFYDISFIEWFRECFTLRGILILLSALLFGLVNHFVWSFRDAPLVFSDLASVSTAAKVASGYTYDLNDNCLLCISVASVYSIILFILPTHKVRM